MLPTCNITHTMPGRTRIRISAMKGNRKYFQHAEQIFREFEGVDEVETNYQTGSILILHSSNLENLKEFGIAHELFDFDDVEHDLNKKSVSQSVASGMRDLESRLMKLTGQRMNGKEVVFSGLLVLALFQMLKGSILPAGATLIWYGMSILNPLDKKTQ
jgi:Heavy metal associated domain 2